MKIGFIGCGNMGGAMMKGILSSGKALPQEVMASDALEAVLQQKQAELSIQTTESNRKVAEFAEILFLSIKPQYYETVIAEIREVVTPQQLIVTIAPGKTLEWTAGQFGKNVKIVRAMPNTPAMVMEGMTALCPNDRVTEEELSALEDICSGFGKTERVTENLMDVVTAVSGSSPAYVFLFIEAMADAAVAEGMPRNQAYHFASQAVLGSAKMVLDIEKHPGELKDMVCSPAGTTIEAVRVLEEKGLRSAVFEAVKACAAKSRSL
jgi:pyrroline-5-carboxylate reductase